MYNRIICECNISLIKIYEIIYNSIMEQLFLIINEEKIILICCLIINNYKKL